MPKVLRLDLEREAIPRRGSNREPFIHPVGRNLPAVSVGGSPCRSAMIRYPGCGNQIPQWAWLRRKTCILQLHLEFRLVAFSKHFLRSIAADSSTYPPEAACTDDVNRGEMNEGRKPETLPLLLLAWYHQILLPDNRLG
jgi:hypothetical protein